MNTTRIAIFIDGGYLDATTRSECGGIRIDYAKLAQKLAGGSGNFANLLLTPLQKAVL
jgi:hypothetical protein